MQALQDVSNVTLAATAVSMALGLGVLSRVRAAQTAADLKRLAAATARETAESWDSEETARLAGDAPSEEERVRGSGEGNRSSGPALTRHTLQALLELALSELGAKLRDREVTSRRLVQIVFHCARAVHQATNCCTEHDLAGAIAAAEDADARFAAGEARGELDGIPISVKDVFYQRGSFATSGTAVLCRERCEEDSPLIAVLREAGAIPLVRTNVPQSLMVPESTNNIWGATLNPWDLSRTPGGSSGGEGALIAARGSFLGLGTDIGGSLRIPAHFSGIAAFKPTPQRVSHSGFAVPRKGGVSGQEGILPVAGPMARRVADLLPVMRAWLSPRMKALDAAAPVGLWDEAQFRAGGKLRFGVFATDPYFPATPACRRAVDEAAEALRRAGHEVVSFDPPPLHDAVTIYLRIMGSDGAMRTFREGLAGEALHPMYSTLRIIASLPRLLRPAVAAVLGVVGEARLAEILRIAHGRTAYEYWEVVCERIRYQEEFLRRWRAAGVDAVLMPGGSVPAYRHGDSRQLTLSVGYTMLANVLHVPAGNVTTTRVRADEEEYASAGGPRDRLYHLVEGLLRGSRGLPVSVQVMALPWKDELCLRALQEVEDAVGGAFAERPPVCAVGAGFPDLRSE